MVSDNAFKSLLKALKLRYNLRRYRSVSLKLEGVEKIRSEADYQFGLALFGRGGKSSPKEGAGFVHPLANLPQNGGAIIEPFCDTLFQEISVKCGSELSPEVLSDDEIKGFHDLYSRSVRANREKNRAELISIATRLNIKIEEKTERQIAMLRYGIEKAEREIERVQSSDEWKWYHSTGEQKKGFLDKRLKQLEKIPPDRDKTLRLILGLGHPRTGTGYTVAAMRSWGLKVGHEILDEDGIVAWQLAVGFGPWPYLLDCEEFDHQILIYNVRDPRTAIASIVYTEDKKHRSLDFRVFEGGVSTSPNRVEQAILSILRWDELISSRNPDFIYRIEDQIIGLFEFLKKYRPDIEFFEPPRNVNRRKHKSLNSLEAELVGVSDSLRREINNYCSKYGYEPLFK